jgi:oxygen-independent coproporphyrinogen-3 oxidase
MTVPLILGDERKELAVPGTAPALASAGGGQVAMHWQPGWTVAFGSAVDVIPGARPEHAAALYREALGELARRPEEAISLSIRVPFCPAHCLFCDRNIHAAQPDEVIEDYVAGLIDEIRAVADLVGTGRDVLQLHLGGGTANELSSSQVARLMDGLHRSWRLPADAEMSVECDPRRAGWGQLRLLRGLGFRQVTYGVLDLDPRVQRAIGRLQSAALIDDVCSLSRECGMEYVNLKMMIGLPHQTSDSWALSLDRLVAMAPDRVTLAHYRHRPWQAPAQQLIDADAVPDGATCKALMMQTAERLCEAGYRWIGADQFVLDTDELAVAFDQGRLRRSLIAYTATPATPVLGLGAGAVGEIDGAAFCNTMAVPAWREAVRRSSLAVAHAQRASERGSRRRAAVEHLLCWLELPLSMVRDGLEDIYGQLAGHEPTGHVRVLPDRIVVTEAGRHALLTLCACLDAPAATRRMS